VVSKNYLGAINHTLLTIELLKARNINILGIIYNGEAIDYVRELIAHHSGVKQIGSIKQSKEVTKQFVAEQAAMLRAELSKHYQL
jgi:dethiobiotin synthetase